MRVRTRLSLGRRQRDRRREGCWPRRWLRNGRPVARRLPGDSSFTIDLAPSGMTQVNDLLARLPAGARDGLIVRVGVVSDEGALVAYLSQVNNTTNDASYQEGFRFGY
jgi:hypothetical protein